MCRSCRSGGKQAMHTEIWRGNLLKNGHLKDEGDGMITLGWILEGQVIIVIVTVIVIVIVGLIIIPPPGLFYQRAFRRRTNCESCQLVTKETENGRM
jgi:hypothetical protein